MGWGVGFAHLAAGGWSGEPMDYGISVAYLMDLDQRRRNVLLLAEKASIRAAGAARTL